MVEKQPRPAIKTPTKASDSLHLDVDVVGWGTEGGGTLPLSGGAMHMHAVNFSSRVPLSLAQWLEWRRHPPIRRSSEQATAESVACPERHLRGFCQKNQLIAVRHAASGQPSQKV